MRNYVKKKMAMMLVFVLLLGVVPVNMVWAEGGEEPTSTITADVNVHYVDSESNIVQDPTVTTVVYGEPQTITAPVIEGWVVTEITEVLVTVDEEGVANPTEVVFTYEQEEVVELVEGIVIVNYVDSEGVEIADPESKDVVFGQENRIEAKVIEGYEVAGDDFALVEIDAEGNVSPTSLTFVYNEVEEEEVIVVNKAQLNGILIYANTLNEANYSQETWSQFEIVLNASVEVYNNPTATQSEVNDAYSNMTEVISSLVTTYGVVRVRYVDIETNEDLVERFKEEGIQLGESRTYDAIEIPDYTIHGESSKTVTIEEEGQNIVVIFTYRAKEVQVITTLRDEEGNVLQEPEVQFIKRNTSVTISAPEIEGYELVGEGLVEVTPEDIGSADLYHVSFTYKVPTEPEKKAKYEIVALDLQGIELIKTELEELVLGEHTILLPVIPDYVSLQGTQFKINLTEEDKIYTIEVLYATADEVASFKVNFVDQSGNVLRNPDIGYGPKGETFTYILPAIAGHVPVSGYDLEIALNEDGSMKEVTAIYKELVINVTVNYRKQNGDLLGTEVVTFNNYGTHTVNAKSFAGYTVVGNSSVTVNLVMNEPIPTVYITYQAIVTPPTGGGGGVYVPPTTPVQPKPEPEVVIDNKDVTKVEDIKLEDMIIRDNAVAISKEVVEVKTLKRASIEVSAEEVAKIAKEGKVIRALVYNEAKDKWVPKTTFVYGNKVYTEALVTGKVAFFAVEEPKFTDIKTNDWFGTYVDRANAWGFVKGFDATAKETVFQPNKGLSKAEFYTMVSRLFGASVEGEISLYNTLPQVTEVTGNEWFKPYQKGLLEKGFLQVEETTQEMNSEITRIDAMVLLTKLIGSVENIETVDAGSFKDSKEFAGVKIINSISGYGNGDLGATNSLTRAEVTALIIKTLEATGW